LNQISEKLAHFLEQLKLLQDSGIIAVQSKMLERTDIIKTWLHQGSDAKSVYFFKH
jgi:hypothetical protein